MAVVAGLLGLFYLPLLCGQSHMWEDLLYGAFSAFNYLGRNLAVGHFPLWLSGVRCGIPFFSDPWVYYPPYMALALCVRDGTLSSLAIQWSLVLNLLLGGYFTYAFLRASRLGFPGALAGTVVLTFSAFLSLHFIHGGMGHAFLWLPVELYLVRRLVERRGNLKDFIWLALSIWMSFLAGFPQSVLYNAYFTAAYWLFLELKWVSGQRGGSVSGWIRGGLRVVGQLVGVYLVVALLGALVVIPTVQSWSMSHRQEFGFAQIADLSLPWYYLLHGLVPNFFGMTNGDGSGVPFWGFNKDTLDYANWHGGAWMYWEFGFYAGQLALIAVGVMLFNIRRLSKDRPESLFFLGAVLPILWLMLGRYGGLFNLLYHVAPGFSMFRTPARFSGLLDFCLAVLAGVLVNELVDGRRSLRVKGPLLAIGALYGLVLGGLFLFGSKVFPELRNERFYGHAVMAVVQSLLLFLSMAGLVGLMASGRFGRQARIGAMLLAALAFLDLYLAFHRFHQGSVKPEDYFADRNGLIAQMTQLREQEGPFRFAQLRDGKISEEVVFPRNIGYLYPGYEAIEGYILFNMKGYQLFNSITNERIRLAVQNVGVVANADRTTGRVSLMKYTNSLPRVKFYHHVRAYDEAKAICADLDAGRLDYHSEIGVLRQDCLTYGVATGAVPATASATAHITPVSPEEYRISYQTTAPGIIFVSESFYPGWYADGGRYPIISTFGAFKGIVVPEAGSGVIVVKFSPPVLWIGLAITLSTLGVLVALLGWSTFRTRRKAA